MPNTFSGAEAVQLLANSLIAQFHPHLATARVRYVYREKAAKRGSRLVPGAVRKLGGALEYLLEADFLVEVALDVWNTQDENQRRAIIDHLLSQCKGEEDEKTGDMKWGKRHPDVQEYAEVLHRNGAWHPDLANFVEVAKGVDAPAPTAPDVGTQDFN